MRLVLVVDRVGWGLLVLVPMWQIVSAFVGMADVLVLGRMTPLTWLVLAWVLVLVREFSFVLAKVLGSASALVVRRRRSWLSYRWLVQEMQEMPQNARALKVVL